MSAGVPYLNEAIDPTVRAAGGVVAVPTDGIAALGSNPSYIDDASDDGFRFVSIRVPETRVQILTPDAAEGLREAYRISRDGYSLGLVRRAIRLSDSTQLAAELAFGASGQWTRVDHGGTALNTFPKTDWLVGVSLARRLDQRLSAGVTAKWLKTKYSDVSEPAAFGHGWAYDVGLQYRLPTWRFGVVARNLSNGLSSPDPERPRDTPHELAIGTSRSVALSGDVALDLAADLRFPSHRGVQTAGGATLTYRDDAGVGVGYSRRLVRWQAQRDDLLQDAVATDERLWIAEGPSFGTWIQVGGWAVTFAASTLFLPKVNSPDERIVETDRWLWTLGVGRGR